MPLSLPNTWVWDFWFAEDGDVTHVFYLQAPATPHDQLLRHRHATIGHAVSTDLRDWTVLDDAVHPGSPGSWDDAAIWTGSVIENDGRWYLLYTSASRAEKGRVQRIGLAVSDDLVSWRKHPNNPVMEADERWYERLVSGDWAEEAWRDPFVFRGEDGWFHALITARHNTGPVDERGVIGHARSPDLVQWEVLPPLVSPWEFADMEVPQLRHIEGRSYLLFSVAGFAHSSRRMARCGGATTGTYYLMADHELGPFATSAVHTLYADRVGTLYAGRVFRHDGGLAFMAFRYLSDDGEFVGTLTDPVAVTVAADGRLGLQHDDLSALHP